MGMRLLLVTGVALMAAVSGCGDDDSPSAAVSDLFEEKPEEAAEVCDTLSTGVADRDDLEAQIMDMPLDEREDFVESFRTNLADAIEGAEDFGFAETRDLLLTIFDECDDRGM